MNTVFYKGRLYAGNAYGADNAGADPSPGPQLLVLDRAGGAWRQEHAFSEMLPNGSHRFFRLSALKAVTLTTDAQGRKLQQPVSRLLVGLTTLLKDESAIYSWDDENDAWVELHLPANTVRAIGFYNDPTSGTDLVFAGGGTPNASGAIFSGAYDPTAPGEIRWKQEPADFENRVMSFEKCNGHLYFSAKPSVYERQDGPNATWKKIYTYPQFDDTFASGIRGLTCIPKQDGDGEALLGVIEGGNNPAPGPGEVLRIDPQTGTAVVEADIRGALTKLWHTELTWVIGAQNDIPTLRDPLSGEPFQIIGLSVQCHLGPCPDDGGADRSAWYVTRDSQARYALHEVRALGTTVLDGVRGIALSRFPAEAGKVVYMGGHDVYPPAHCYMGNPTGCRVDHNTAWIYRAGVRSVLAGGVPLD
jgi:hypothetical protein